MIIKKIKINSVNDVKDFQNKMIKYDEDIDIIKGRYIIDAKSLMGIFTIDLSEPFDLAIHTDDLNRAAEFFDSLGDMVVE